MKLHVFPIAPNGAKVVLYLEEKAAAGCPIDLEEVPVSLIEGEHRKPEFLAMNPRGTIPVLELDDGTILHESLAIIEYLEELHPTPSLWGDDPKTRALARQLERAADLSGLIPIAREIHASNSPLGRPPDPPVAEYHRALWQRGLAFLEERLSDGRPFLAGDAVTVADCTLAAAFQFARFRELPVLADAPRLQAWDARFRARPSAKKRMVF